MVVTLIAGDVRRILAGSEITVINADITLMTGAVVDYFVTLTGLHVRDLLFNLAGAIIAAVLGATYLTDFSYQLADHFGT